MKTIKVTARVLSLLMAGALLLAGCGSQTTPSAAATPAAGGEQAAAPKSDVKIGVVLTTSGKGDKSYNDLAIAGFERLKSETGINYKEIQPKEVADIEKSLEFLAKEKYDLVFTIGFNAATALKNVSAKYPDTKFVIIDYNYGDEIPANVKSIIFKEHESSYLGGVLAANMTQNKVVGFIGGMESPTIAKFEVGFKAGVQKVSADVQVLSSYVSADASGFNNPTRAKEIALDMVSKNADIIYYAAGGSGIGALEGISESGIKAIGVDSNQNWMKPGVMYASVVKKVDVAIIDCVEQFIAGTMSTGVTDIYGLETDGVGLTDLSNLTVEETEGISEADQALIKQAKDSIPAQVKEQIETCKQEIISGAIEVPFEK